MANAKVRYKHPNKVFHRLIAKANCTADGVNSWYCFEIIGIHAPLAGTPLMDLKRGNGLKSWEWLPNLEAHG